MDNKKRIIEAIASGDPNMILSFTKPNAVEKIGMNQLYNIKATSAIEFFKEFARKPDAEKKKLISLHGHPFMTAMKQITAKKHSTEGIEGDREFPTIKESEVSNNHIKISDSNTAL